MVIRSLQLNRTLVTRKWSKEAKLNEQQNTKALTLFLLVPSMKKVLFPSPFGKTDCRLAGNMKCKN